MILKGYDAVGSRLDQLILMINSFNFEPRVKG